jgi:hypothetical protein
LKKNGAASILKRGSIILAIKKENKESKIKPLIAHDMSVFESFFIRILSKKSRNLFDFISSAVKYNAPKNIGTSTINPTHKKYVISIGNIFFASRKGIAILQAKKFNTVGIPNNNINSRHLRGFILSIISSSQSSKDEKTQYPLIRVVEMTREASKKIPHKTSINEIPLLIELYMSFK